MHEILPLFEDPVSSADHETTHRFSELAQVPGPGMVSELCDRGGAQVGPAPVLTIELLHKEGRERTDLVRSLSERGNRDLDRVEAT